MHKALHENHSKDNSMNINLEPVEGSFRDPSGRVYISGEKILRSVNECYAENYVYAQNQGLFSFLQQEGDLLPFRELECGIEEAWKTLEVDRVPVISYPYEWSFSQLKDAALLTLKIHREALERGMILKDASAFNVQFMSGRVVFIDILSFERWHDNQPWCAYGQFCRHFLAPLLLMVRRDLRYGLFLKEFIDGFPLDLTSSLLPWHTYLSPNICMHIHAHAWMQRKHENERASAEKARNAKLSQTAMVTLCEGLSDYVAGLSLSGISTEWGDYYSSTNYSSYAFKEKEDIVRRVVHEKSPNIVLDLGANDGHFSKIVSEVASAVIAADIDPIAVEKHYLEVRKGNRNIIPMIVDLINPSPALGWHGKERSSFFQRCQADMILALALVHHLAISNNVPLSKIAEMFACLGQTLIVEFVPKSDSQLQRLLASRKDIFTDYNEDGFRRAFSKYFTIEECIPVPESERKLFVMTGKGAVDVSK